MGWKSIADFGEHVAHLASVGKKHRLKIGESTIFVHASPPSAPTTVTHTVGRTSSVGPTLADLSHCRTSQPPRPPQNVSLHCILQVWIRPCSNLGLESPEKESQTFVKKCSNHQKGLGSHPVIIPRPVDSLYYGLSFSAKDLPHLFTWKGYPSLTKIWVFRRHSGQLEPPLSNASPISSPITHR